MSILPWFRLRGLAAFFRISDDLSTVHIAFSVLAVIMFIPPIVIALLVGDRKTPLRLKGIAFQIIPAVTGFLNFANGAFMIFLTRQHAALGLLNRWPSLYLMMLMAVLVAAISFIKPLER
jgi:hypothetical protein